MPRRVISLVILGTALVLVGRSASAQTQIQIYGSWHCGSDFCTWGSVREYDGLRHQESLDDRSR